MLISTPKFLQDTDRRLLHKHVKALYTYKMFMSESFTTLKREESDTDNTAINSLDGFFSCTTKCLQEKSAAKPQQKNSF